jgi:hypothetical protein
VHCDDGITGNVSETDTANKKKNATLSPPISISDVTDYNVMVVNLAEAVDEETHFIKTLSKNTVRINALSSEM